MKLKASQTTIDGIASILSDAYGLSGELRRLPGENENYELRTTQGDRFILKVAGEFLPVEILELEHRIVEWLSTASLDLSLPHSYPNLSGEPITSVNHPPIQCRLITFVDGTPWAAAGEPGLSQLRDFGKKIAALDTALAGYEDPQLHRSHRWDLAAASQHRQKLRLINDAKRRAIVEWMFHFYTATALPALDNLPWSLIHGDANDENILVQDGKVVGLLDFGDSLYNPTVCDLAIALAYAMLDQAEPLQAGAEVVSGYRAHRPLSPAELDVLYPLVCARLCTTVTVAAERRLDDPAHPTWFVTEEPAWKLLRLLYTIDPDEAAGVLSGGDQSVRSPESIEDGTLLMEKRRRWLGLSLSVAYDQPLVISRGAGQYLFDHHGRPFLDLVNNVCHVGHCHPRVVEAGQRQMALLNTNTRYIYDGLTAYAERLCATLPESLEVCFFVNSGSEANELALRMAETYNGRRDFLVIDGAYHGHTRRLIDLSPYKFMGAGGRGRPEPWVHVVPMPDGYRGPHKGQDLQVGSAYADEVGRVIHESGAPIAAFIAEPLLGCGGQIIPPDGYLEGAFQHVRDAGGLCIIDEVQVGFGRVGTHFWGFERQGVVPDIVVMGKPIGNGHPMAAVVTTRAIADSFANGMEFFSTFGGNPVSCAIGMAVLDVMEEEGLQAHALEMGAVFLEGLESLKARHPLIGDVRGAGLFIGIELVRDRKNLEPAAEEAGILVNRMRSRGVLLSTDGPLKNVIKIKPPLVLSREDIEMTLRVMDDELSLIREG